MRSHIDLNCDLGEGVGIEAAILPYVSTINIACGAHAGDEALIRNTIRLAKEQQVAIGAHPSYPDRENFGRTVLPITAEDLQRSVRQQIDLVRGIAFEEHYPITHIKLHGALYNHAAKEDALATLLVETIAAIDPLLLVFGLPGSALEQRAVEHNLRFVKEAFADRTYQDDGSLTPRAHPNALIEDNSDCVQQVLRMIRLQEVVTLSGKIISLSAETVCLHGDGLHAVAFAKSLWQELKKENIIIRAAHE
jgi:UPF0271 protein